MEALPFSTPTQVARLEFDKNEEYKRLNELLIEKKKVSDKIQALHQELNLLRRKYSNLEEEFSREVIKVTPSEVVTVKKTIQSKSPEQILADRIKEAVKKDATLAGRLQDLIEFGS